MEKIPVMTDCLDPDTEQTAPTQVPNRAEGGREESTIWVSYERDGSPPAFEPDREAPERVEKMSTHPGSRA